MALTWTKENPPRWDADKRRLFGEPELAATDLTRPADDEVVADEWWHVSADDDAIVGYGWLDSEWGDAQITFLVDPARRGQGIGAFIVDRLEREAADRGLNYIYNVVPPSHPDAAWLSHWLSLRGFRADARGQLRRRVGPQP